MISFHSVANKLPCK